MCSINYFDKYLNLISYLNNSVIEIGNEITKRSYDN